MFRALSLTFMAIFLLGTLGDSVAYKTWSEYESCDRDTITTYIYRACVTFKRAAKFFQPESRFGELNLKPAESEETNADDILLTFLGKSQARRVRGMSPVPVISEVESGNTYPRDAVKSNAASISPGLRTRSTRNAQIMNMIVEKCCGEEGCDISDFIRMEQLYRYCDTS